MDNFWLILLYALASYGLVSYFKRVAIDENNTKIRWSPIESVAVTIFIYFAGQIIAGLCVYSILLALGWDQSRIENWLGKNALGIFITSLLVSFLSLGSLVIFLKRRTSSFVTVGLSRKPKLKDLGYALVMLIAYFSAYIIAISIISKLIPSIDIEQEQQLGFDNVSSIQLPLVFITLVVLPPILEEIIMRGFLYTGLKNRMPYAMTVFITSGLFAIAHLQFGSGAPLLWVAAIDTFVLSLFLIYLREKTGSLWSPIFLHGLKNFIAFMSIFVFKVL